VNEDRRVAIRSKATFLITTPNCRFTSYINFSLFNKIFVAAPYVLYGCSWSSFGWVCCSRLLGLLGGVVVFTVLSVVLEVLRVMDVDVV